MTDIFISYAREDKDAARRLADKLEARGWSAWWDAEIPPGETWDEVIERELTAARVALVLWSQRSVAKRWVKTEASLALDKNKLLPVLIDNVIPPIAFRTIQAAPLFDWHGEDDHEGYRQLVTAIERLAGQPSGGTARGEPAGRDTPPQPSPPPAAPARRWPIIAAAAGGLGAAVIAGVLLLGNKPDVPPPTVERVEPGLAPSRVDKATRVQSPTTLQETSTRTAPCAVEVADPNPPTNVRAGPATSQPVVGRLANGTLVTMTGRNDGWISLSDPVAGWVAGNLLRLDCTAEGGLMPGRYPMASERMLTAADLEGKSPQDLRLMRNEIYARRGYMFNDAALRAYFESQPWYVPLSGSVQLSELERANVRLIQSLERPAAH